MKKGINAGVYDVIDDCFSVELYNPDMDTKKTGAIVDEAVELRNALIAKVNSNVKKGAKKHFNEIIDELALGLSALQAKVDKLA